METLKDIPKIGEEIFTPLGIGRISATLRSGRILVEFDWGEKIFSVEELFGEQGLFFDPYGMEPVA